jgi:hypothetical protein
MELFGTGYGFALAMTVSKGSECKDPIILNLGPA